MRANPSSTSHRFCPILVTFVGELTKETIFFAPGLSPWRGCTSPPEETSSAAARHLLQALELALALKFWVSCFVLRVPRPCQVNLLHAQCALSRSYLRTSETLSSYLRIIDFVCHSTQCLRVIKKRRVQVYEVRHLIMILPKIMDFLTTQTW